MAKYTYPLMANKIALDLSKTLSPEHIPKKNSVELKMCIHSPVLIVDDDEFNILGCSFILNKFSLSSMSANNGEKAI